MILLFLALILSPAYAITAEEVLMQHDRWDYWGGINPGDSYTYLICDKGTISRCYEAGIDFVRYSNEGYWIAEVTTQDVFGRYMGEGATLVEYDRGVSGEHEPDKFLIDYIGMVMDLPPSAQSMVRITDRGEIYPLTTQVVEGYELSLDRTLFLLGGSIRIGDGTILENDPILEIGRQWNLSDGQPGIESGLVSVTAVKDDYFFEGLKLDSRTYVIQYRGEEPVLELIVASGVPFPLSADVISEPGKDAHVSDMFWFRLVDTNNPMFERADDPLPPPISPIFQVEPEVEPEITPEAIKVEPEIIEEPEPSIIPEIIPTDLEGLFAEFLDTLGIGDEYIPEAGLVKLEHTMETGASEVRDISESEGIITVLFNMGGGEDTLHLSIPLENRGIPYEVFADGVQSNHVETSTQTHRILEIPIDAETLEITAHLRIDDIPEDETIIGDCFGEARCIHGVVTQVTDGDTISIDGGQGVRFALASAPETYEAGGAEATALIAEACPVGSTVVVDEDDKQTRGSYGRIIGVVHCNGINLNEILVESGLGYILERYCGNSEFADHSWAVNSCR